MEEKYTGIIKKCPSGEEFASSDAYLEPYLRWNVLQK